MKTKKVVSTMLVVFILLGAFIVTPVFAETAVPLEEQISPRWTHFSSASLTCHPNGNGSITYSATLYGRNTATYSVFVYLMRSDGTVAAGPSTNGPNSWGASAGSSATVSPGWYYTKAYLYAYSDGKLVEYAAVESGLQYVS